MMTRRPPVDTEWNLPPKCRACEDRDNDYCRRYERLIWQAWRMVDGCDVMEVEARCD